MQNHVQSISQAHGGYNTTAQVRPVQPALSQPQINPSYGNYTGNEHESMDQKKRLALESKGDLLPDKTAGRKEAGVPSQDNAQKDLNSLPAKSIDDEYRQRASSDIDVRRGDSDELMDKRTVKKEEDGTFLKPKSAAKSADATVKSDKDACDDVPKELDQTLEKHGSSDATDGSIKNLNSGRDSHDATTDGGVFSAVWAWDATTEIWTVYSAKARWSYDNITSATCRQYFSWPTPWISPHCNDAFRECTSGWSAIEFS